MKQQGIINHIEGGNKTVGSNPTPSESYRYNDLRRDSNTAVIIGPKKAHYQQLNLNSRGGYDLTPDAHVWHPDPNVRSMLFAQIEARK
jgi:hypothetical protein